MRLRFLTLTFLLVASSSLLAVDISSVAKDLTVGGGVLQKLLWASCIVVGILLIAAAFTQFQIHRRNPKLVPLTTPVMYLILGIVAIAIPFFNTEEGFMGEAVEQIKSSPDQTPNTPSKKQEYYDPNDIDSPIY